METNNYNAYPDEISLREIIEVILKGWKFIVSLVLTAVIISAIISFTVISPTYQASATLMASAAVKVEAPHIGEGVDGLLDSLSALPLPTLDTYKEQVKNPTVLQSVLDELGPKAEGLTRRQLANKISVEIVNNTNLLRINVKNGDPGFATDVANSVAINFTKYISDLAREQATTSYEYIVAQLEVEKDILDNVMKAYKGFLAQPRSVQELQAEISSRLKLVTSYKVQYIQKGIEEDAKSSALEMLQQELAATEKILTTRKSLSEDAFLNNAVSETMGISPVVTGLICMDNEEINPYYLELQSTVSVLKAELATLATERKGISSQIEQNAAILKELQIEHAEKQNEENRFKKDIDLAQHTYDAFYEKYEEVRIAQSGKVGESNITFVTPAIEPTTPISPNKRLNIAIAAMLGLMLSIFIVFLKDYWEKTSE